MRNDFSNLVEEIRNAYQRNNDAYVSIGFGDKYSNVGMNCFARNIIFLGIGNGNEAVGLRIRSDEDDACKFEFEIKMNNPLEVERIEAGYYKFIIESGDLYLVF